MARYLDIDGTIAASTLEANTVSEKTAGSGVTIDSLLIQDGSVQPADIADPGDAGAIPVVASGVCHLVTAGAETRTLADPTVTGLRLTLYFLTDGGNCVVTATSPLNGTGNNTITLADADESVDMVSVRDGASSYAWRVVGTDFNTGALSTV